MLRVHQQAFETSLETVVESGSSSTSMSEPLLKILLCTFVVGLVRHLAAVGCWLQPTVCVTTAGVASVAHLHPAHHYSCREDWWCAGVEGAMGGA